MYVEVWLAYNWALDFLLLVAANRLMGFPWGFRRCALAAALGGVYACACLAPGFAFLGGRLWQGIFLMLLGAAAYGVRAAAWKRTLLFSLLSLALGGAAVYLDAVGAAPVLFLALLLGLLAAVCVKGRVLTRRIVGVELRWAGKSMRFFALHDTGNVLRDPISGDGVLVVSPAIGERLGLGRELLADPAAALSAHPGLRLIPFQSVGQSGFLVGLRPERLRIDGRESRAIVAFAPQGIGQGEYSALTGGIV